MSESHSKPSTVLSRWRCWIKNQVMEVPEEIAICEFDCEKEDCTAEQWRACQRRLGAQRQGTRTVQGERKGSVRAEAWSP